MKKNLRIILIIIAILITGLLLFFFIKNGTNSSNDEKLLKYLVSSDTHFIRSNDSEETMKKYINQLNDELAKYCDEKGINTYLANRTSGYYMSFIEKNNIVKTENIKVKLMSEKVDKEEDTIFREYAVLYTYVDNNDDKYYFSDYYNLYVHNNKINYLSIIHADSDIVKKYKELNKQ